MWTDKSMGKEIACQMSCRLFENDTTDQTRNK